MILDGGYVYCDDLQCANASNIEYVNNCPMSKKIECNGTVSDYYNSGFITRQNQILSEFKHMRTANGNQGSGDGICENKTMIYDPYWKLSTQRDYRAISALCFIHRTE